MTAPTAFRPYRPTPAEARKLKASGWHTDDGEHWYPPYPSSLSYTYRAAVAQHAADWATQPTQPTEEPAA